MVVRLRLARFGRHKLPFYRMVAVDSRVRRDGKPLEVVGTWNPLPDKFGAKHLRLNMERVKYWLGVGAQPTSIVHNLLSKADLLEPPCVPTPDPNNPKGKKKDKEKSKKATSK
ncbi:30S ribosomal protein S16 [Plasmodiophora brassicae]|uniref:30S ribosomal protein S16 n=1 Tax=Plasmodiophora brassicae TaxID=37360 RepID=A0A0G4IK70_PLABS|nr:hypothetical protein PBRA_004347 [Plasmodiophora brassicae]SPR00488.1 unnamed protein product [Plasmodiophora brassicae]